MSTRIISIMFQVEILEKMDRVAKARRESRSDFIRKLIITELAKLNLMPDFDKQVILEAEA